MEKWVRFVCHSTGFRLCHGVRFVCHPDGTCPRLGVCYAVFRDADGFRQNDKSGVFYYVNRITEQGSVLLAAQRFHRI